jgi:phosphoenolpyruvate carboxylase
MTPREVAASDEAILRAVLTLWQTSLIRHDRPTVADEVANGISYFDQTFLRELPYIYSMIEDRLAEHGKGGNTSDLPSFFRMGSWIGGDRDGNPFVTSEVLNLTAAMHSRKVLNFYLDELHQLGAELPLDAPPNLIAERSSASIRGWRRPPACSARTCNCVRWWRKPHLIKLQRSCSRI